MAKKSKRRAQPASRRPAAGSAANAATRPAQAAPVQSAADLASEYHYVLGDLRRVGILAASMFALLIVVALVAQLVIK